MRLGLRLDKSTDNANQNPLYQKLIGALMYLAVATRPDICFAVSYLSQFNSCNSKEHFKAAERVVRYLKGTTNMGLSFFKGQYELKAYADADYGSCIVDRRSFTGYVFKLANGAISWAAKKQRSLTVADSTTFAE
ncbi:uncharacterized protein LOC113561749 [Ooceraea biroi]|uniref:uncharacterized protein LOC113561749 n=1 Tax=Ooceraea biroi TaxID=2015173 RepID=UPI000F080BF4|nr:uncharacterized protein LOC113561749 [Ooceraea biroi]